MDWIQVFTIIGVNSGIMIWMVTRIDRDVDRIDRHLADHATKIDQTNSRLDQLYNTMIELLRERKIP